MKSFYKSNLIVLLLSIIVAGFNNCNAQCQSKTIIKESKKKLSPYKYSGAAIKEIIIDEKTKILEVEFTAYADQEYKLIFSPSDNLTEDIRINIFDKRKNMRMRSIVWATTSKNATPVTFEPRKSGNYFIEYIVPATAQSGIKKEGCMVLMIGYQTKK